MTIAQPLLAWYDINRRVLPWRVLPGQIADPYRVWLSEIMLQQTVAATVIPYFHKFTALWPTVEALAAAGLDNVLTAWAGLGYYARARNLHKCAQMIVAQYDGKFPGAVEDLLSLPGIGLYTAGAIAAIAFDIPALAADGNVERVVSRLYRIGQPLPAARTQLHQLAASLVPRLRAGDFAQALMDLGATICTPTNPKCLLCPLNPSCAAFEHGDPSRFPLKQPKTVRPVRYGRVFWVADRDGTVLVQRRIESGLLGGMMEFPSSPWSDKWPDDNRDAPLPNLVWRELPGEVRHVFTHFELKLKIAHATLPPAYISKHGQWVRPENFATLALPSVMRKIAKHVETHG